MCRFFCRVDKEFARSQPTKTRVVVFQQTSWKKHCHRQSASLGRWPVSRVFTNWDHSAADNCLWHPRWLDPQYLPLLQMVHDSFDEFEVWSLNKSMEGEKMLPLDNICRRAELCPGSARKNGATWVRRARGLSVGSCQTFCFFLLPLIKRLGEDQPCPIKNGRVGLACTGQGCPNQGLLG